MFTSLTDRAGVFTGGVNVGVVHGLDNHVVLVDTGANEGNARKLVKHLREEMHVDVSAILITHGHADHFGGNAFVVKRTGAAVYAPDFEESVLRHPELQPIFMYGGASPPVALRERFVLAHASPVDHVVMPGTFRIDDIDIDVIPLPGHSPNQVGYLIDGVFFCADVVFPQDAISKYRIPYLFDLGDHLESMDVARRIDARWFVPGHGPIEKSLRDLHHINTDIVEETLAVTLSALSEALGLEQLVAAVFDKMQVPIANEISYYLLRPTIGAYLTYLGGQGKVESSISGRSVVWQATR